MAAYEIAIDKNGDGFIGWDVSASDPLNVVPNPVSYDGLNVAINNASWSLIRLETAYGLNVFDVTLNVSTAGVYFGVDGPTIAEIPVVGGQAYTAGLWVRLSPGETVPVTANLNIFADDGTSRGTAPVTITTDWQQVGRTFSANPADSYIAIGLEKGVGTAAANVQVTGLMTVQAISLPGTFNTGDADEYQDPITGDVLAMTWRLGMRRPFDLVAAPTTGTITVDNSAGTYSPERGLTRLEPNTRVKIRVTVDGVTTDLFTGLLDYVEPDPAGRTAQLHLRGQAAALDETRVLTELLTDVTPDAVLDAVCAQPPLDQLERQFRASETRFAYVGDTWDDGVRASSVVEQVLEAERGRFFTDRAGRLVFYDRAYLPNLPVNPVTFDNAFEDIDYRYGDLLLNWARVELRPRALGTPGSVVWSLNSAQEIPPNGCRVIVARFRDSNGDRMGATGLITPVPVTDYTANTAADGTGADVTGDVSMTFVAGGSASAVYLEICNTNALPVYVQAGAQVRGQPLTQGNPLLVEVRDDVSINAYGPRTLALNLPYLVTVDEAATLAEAVVFLRKRPSGAVHTLHLSNRARFDDALTLTLFDQVRVQEASTGHLDDYFIIAEEHMIDRGGARHRVAWLLEPVNPGGVWKLGVDGLNTSTRLGVRF